MTLNRHTIITHLRNFDLRTLFIEVLGWDHGGADTVIHVGEQSFALDAVAHKRGMVAYQFVADSETTFPEHATRRKIEKAVAKEVREHIIVYATHDRTEQSWQWVKREPGQPDRHRSESFRKKDTGERLIQKLENLVFTLKEEEDLTIVDVSGRVRAAFDVEKVTKRFYDRFKKEHETFLDFIDGIADLAGREWYASLMLNRMMFIYFIQKRGFLDSDADYLRNRLAMVRQKFGNDRYNRFYRLFLLKLFHEGLGQPEADRAPELAALLGDVPFLNGGLFDVHDLEKDNPEIQIPDEAFERIFNFFDAYTWHLDDRPLRNDNEINPDVLGYIFEKYINQKQMGAYYTKEDITGYISRNTVIPFLFDRAKKECPIAFRTDGGVWALLEDDPDRYFYEAVRHGITYDMHRNEDLAQKRDLPPGVAAGVDDVSRRDGWNEPASPDFALPTETWREHVARRRHYEEVRAKLVSGEVTAINDLITFNLDIEKFTQDVIAGSEGPELIRGFWKAITGVSILDPTCGSGAFLFAALNILEPIYTACLEAMRGLLDDLQRSKRKHRPEKMNDFRQILKQVESHPSERYFILKSIIINNLYGVDIMEEAVEICKLRLFLKLVAQLENVDQIEPLPDIDFNIRAGNTLVGFTSLDDVRRAVSGDLFKEQSLPDIEERAETADRAFRMFQEMQTEREMDASAFAKAKVDLRRRLDDLRNQLDRYLAGEYGVKDNDATAYQSWLKSHQPFHWFVEFNGIVQSGGFDVILGNPPYLETRQVPYLTKHFSAQESGAIHAICIERSITLCKRNGCMSMIVPLALVSTQRMTVLQVMLEDGRDCWYSNFAWRPGKLFDTVNRALTVFVAAKPSTTGETFSTAYLKWNSNIRDYLIPSLRYVRCPRKRSVTWVPKIGHPLERSILEKLSSIDTPMDIFTVRAGSPVYYRTTGGLYWKIFTDFAPKFYVNGVAGNSSRETRFFLREKKHVTAAIALLSSDLFWWWYTVTSNLRDLNPYDWKNFPAPESAMNDSRIQELGRSYITDLQRYSTLVVRNQRSTGRTETQAFKVQKSKPIIDQIDAVLVKHYGFSDEELDFIINYDVKYRMGT
ncbi:MAG: SAM-dependent methyltransferase [Candidatus Latescibacteria bacterium]|nr:SAM-dependent methyltransferase [Candidatus Latescibacterota bacterium]